LPAVENDELSTDTMDLKIWSGLQKAFFRTGQNILENNFDGFEAEFHRPTPYAQSRSRWNLTRQSTS